MTGKIVEVVVTQRDHGYTTGVDNWFTFLYDDKEYKEKIFGDPSAKENFTVGDTIKLIHQEGNNDTFIFPTDDTNSDTKWCAVIFGFFAALSVIVAFYFWIKEKLKKRK